MNARAKKRSPFNEKKNNLQENNGTIGEPAKKRSKAALCGALKREDIEGGRASEHRRRRASGPWCGESSVWRGCARMTDKRTPGSDVLYLPPAGLLRTRRPTRSASGPIIAFHHAPAHPAFAPTYHHRRLQCARRVTRGLLLAIFKTERARRRNLTRHDAFSCIMRAPPRKYPYFCAPPCAWNVEQVLRIDILVCVVTLL